MAGTNLNMPSSSQPERREEDDSFFYVTLTYTHARLTHLPTPVKRFYLQRAHESLQTKAGEKWSNGRHTATHVVTNNNAERCTKLSHTHRLKVISRSLSKLAVLTTIKQDCGRSSFLLLCFQKVLLTSVSVIFPSRIHAILSFLHAVL